MRKFALILFALHHSIAYAAESQPIHELKQKIEQYSLKQLKKYNFKKITLKIGNIDKRLKLKSCPNDRLSVFNPYQRSIIKTTTLGIKCNDETIRWTLYVPIKITVLLPVTVSNNYLPVNSAITPNDVQLVEKNIQTLRQGYFKNQQDVVGQIAKRNIYRGKVITPSDLKLAKLITKGEGVIITAKHDAIKVRMKGLAINGGILGDIIRVKNLSSQRIIEAKVVARGKVQVNI